MLFSTKAYLPCMRGRSHLPGVFYYVTVGISNFADYNLYQRKLNVLTRQKYVLYFLTRPLDFYLETREDELSLHVSLNKNKEAV